MIGQDIRPSAGETPARARVDTKAVTGTSVDGSTESADGLDQSEVLDSVSSDATPAVPTCVQCAKPSGINEDGEATLKACNKCHSVSYCNKDCQKAHFKAHKKVCASLAQMYAASHEPSRIQTSRAAPKKSSGQRGLQKWQFDT